MAVDYWIACDQTSHAIGDMEGVAGTSPDDLHLVDIELRLIPLVSQVIDAVHRWSMKLPTSNVMFAAM